MNRQRRRARGSRRAATNARRVPLHVEALESRCLLAADVDLAFQEAAFPLPPEPYSVGLAEEAASEAAISIPNDLPDIVVSWPESDPSFSVDPWFTINVWVAVPGMQESWIPLPTWRSVVGGDGPESEPEDSVGPIAFCAFPGFEPFCKELTGDSGIDAPGASVDSEFGAMGTLAEVEDPGPMVSASDLPEILPADIGPTARPDDAIPSLAATAAAEDRPKPHSPVVAAFAGLPGTLAGSGFAGFGAATSAGEAAGDAGFGVRRRARR